ncbi:MULTISPECIES: hypothetical protein [unclassified Kitasatospora]|uniref:hypothetical protein n=1 Tax=unclassified Kitasatospora TaxID=2633591 RepID=UPI0033D35973
MLPKLGLTAKHQGTKIGRAEIKGAVTDPHAFTGASPAASAAPAPTARDCCWYG